MDEQMEELCNECNVAFYVLLDRISVREKKDDQQIIELSPGELRVIRTALEIAAGI